VTNSRGKVVSLCLFKTGYRLGEDIVGTLDFGDSQVSCTQVINHKFEVSGLIFNILVLIITVFSHFTKSRSGA
jgi:hypothetical protein